MQEQLKVDLTSGDFVSYADVLGTEQQLEAMALAQKTIDAVMQPEAGPSEKQILASLPGIIKIGPIAILPMFGNVANGISPVMEAAGHGFSPQRIASLADRLRFDDLVKKVVVHANSFGGSVAGARELFVAIRDLAKVKPVTVYAEAVCSAAYWAISGATTIVGMPAGLYGSIGVAERKDTAQAGRFVLFRSGKNKMADDDVTAMTPEQKKVIQARVDSLAQVFWTDITSVRPGLTGHAESLREGNVFVGQEAIDNGLLDALADSIHQVLQGVGESPTGNFTGENIMAGENPKNDPTPVLLTEELRAQIQMEGYQSGLLAGRAEPKATPPGTPTAGAGEQKEILKLQQQIGELVTQNQVGTRHNIAHTALALAKNVVFPPSDSIDHLASLTTRVKNAAVAAVSDEAAKVEAEAMVKEIVALLGTKPSTPAVETQDTTWSLFDDQPGPTLVGSTSGAEAQSGKGNGFDDDGFTTIGGFI